MNPPTVLIDLTNLRSGGALQVGASFLDELSELAQEPTWQERFPWLQSMTIEATGPVIANVQKRTTTILHLRQVERSAISPRTWLRRPRHDVAFTLFGPAYGRRRGLRTLVGFADVTSLYPRPPQLAAPNMLNRAKSTLRRLASAHFFRRADHLVVETQAVRNDLATIWRIAPDTIDVVSNCINERVMEPTAPDAPTHEWCYITRGYPHKNIDFLGEVGSALAAMGDESTRFTVTLTPTEWANLRPNTRRFCNNVGPVSISEVRKIYQRSEGSVFPSLLECFSVTPLEALALGKPLVASNRPFVSEICQDAALYAEPDDPRAWAAAILRIRGDAALRASLRDRAAQIINELPTARQRAQSYVEIIDRLAISDNRSIASQ